MPASSKSSVHHWSEFAGFGPTPSWKLAASWIPRFAEWSWKSCSELGLHLASCSKPGSQASLSQDPPHRVLVFQGKDKVDNATPTKSCSQPSNATVIEAQLCMVIWLIREVFLQEPHANDLSLAEATACLFLTCSVDSRFVLGKFYVPRNWWASVFRTGPKQSSKTCLILLAGDRPELFAS